MILGDDDSGGRVFYAVSQRVRDLSQDTVTLLHEAAAGALRDLDRSAATCLRRAARKKRKIIDRDVLGAVLKNTAR